MPGQAAPRWPAGRLRTWGMDNNSKYNNSSRYNNSINSKYTNSSKSNNITSGKYNEDSGHCLSLAPLTQVSAYDPAPPGI